MTFGVWETDDVNLSAVRGTPLVINVWASWCPPCRRYPSSLRQLQVEGQARFLGVDVEVVIRRHDDDGGFDADPSSLKQREIRRGGDLRPLVTFFVTSSA